MFLPRAISEACLEASKQFSVLLLTGPRQVGKTTLLQKIAKKDRNYVTLDDPAARTLAQSDPALFLERFEPPVQCAVVVRAGVGVEQRAGFIER